MRFVLLSPMHEHIEDMTWYSGSRRCITQTNEHRGKERRRHAATVKGKERKPTRPYSDTRRVQSDGCACRAELSGVRNAGLGGLSSTPTTPALQLSQHYQADCGLIHFRHRVWCQVSSRRHQTSPRTAAAVQTTANTEQIGTRTNSSGELKYRTRKRMYIFIP